MRRLIISSALVFAAACNQDPNLETSDLGETAGSAVSSVALIGDGTFVGCRGDGAWVCDEKVDPIYFTRHPECVRNTACDESYSTCSTACPEPTAEETPNVMVKMSGKESPQADILIGYSDRYGFWHHELHGYSVPAPYQWKELTLGVGVHAPAGNAHLRCSVFSEETSGIANVTVVRPGGAVQTLACPNNKVCELDIPVNSGFVATCNAVLIPPPSWMCSASWYSTNDGCDCGCGAPDPDCAGAGTSSVPLPSPWPNACEYCWNYNNNNAAMPCR